MKITGGCIISLELLIILWTGCDKIEGDHFQSNAATDTNYTFPADTTSNVYRVLLEDYTGHLCGNCPAAARIIYNTLLPTYGDDLVVIGVHANYFAQPCPPATPPAGAPAGSYANDFKTPAGEAWYTFFNFYSNPLGMVNRIDYLSGNEIKTSTDWDTEIAGIINNTPQVKIRVHTIYNSSTRQLQTFSETKFLTRLNNNYNLNVILTEDSIVTWQLDDADSIPNIADYVQRHVMRGSLNGNFGVQINTSSPTNAGTTFSNGYSTTLRTGWNASHCHVVVFLFDTINYQILNVAEDSVIE